MNSRHGLSLNDVAGYSPEDEVDWIIRDAEKSFLQEKYSGNSSIDFENEYACSFTGRPDF